MNEIKLTIADAMKYPNDSFYGKTSGTQTYRAGIKCV